jgi:hypothetical protein
MIVAEDLPKSVRKIYPNGVECHLNFPVDEGGVIFKAFTDGVIKVDKLLDHVDLALDWYIPSNDAIKFITFIRLVLGEEPENSNPKPHYFMIDCIFKQPNVVPFFMARNVDFELLKQETVILCSREFSKALTTDTEICTPKGFVTMGDLKVGDSVLNRAGEAVTITHKSKIFDGEGHTTYEMALEDGRYVKLSGDHLNIVIDDGVEKVLTTDELYSNPDKTYYIPLMDNPANFSNKTVPYSGGIITKDILTSNRENRLSILSDILSEGNVIRSNDMDYLHSVQELVWGLGGLAHLHTTSLTINIGFITNKVKIIRLRKIKTVPMQCISVDCPTESYILRNGIVTHNTTLITYLILFMAAEGTIPNFGKINYGLYVSDSMRNGVKKMMDRLKGVYYESMYLQSLFEEVHFTQEESIFIRKPRTSKEIAAYHKVVVVEKKDPKFVPGRMKRTFKVDGLGCAALNLDAKLFTPEGYTTIGECSIGDKIYGADGKLTTITYKSEVFEKPMYELVLEDGRTLNVCQDHINSVELKYDYKGGRPKYKSSDLTTLELLKQDLYWTRNKKKKGKYVTTSEKLVWIKNCEPLDYPIAELPIDPYVMGLLLGDGSMGNKYGSASLHMMEADMLEIIKYIPYETTRWRVDKRSKSRLTTIGIPNIGKNIVHMSANVTCKDKFIPEVYFTASISQRLDVLRGLIDTDGEIKPDGKIKFYSTSKLLRNDVVRLVRSLGGTAFSHQRKNISSKGVKSISYIAEISISMRASNLPRKYNNQKPSRRRDHRVGVIAINKIPIVKSQCIAVDNEEHQFIADDYFRTHNTSSRGASNVLVRPQFCHAKGTEVLTDKGTSLVEDYPKKGWSRFEEGYAIKLVGYEDIEIVTKEHRYWTKINDLESWCKAENLTRNHLIGSIESPDMVESVSTDLKCLDKKWRQIEDIQRSPIREFIPIQTPNHIYTTKFGISHNCIIDDVIANEKDAYSKTILDAIESTIESDIRGGLSGTGYFMTVIGTPYNANDSVYRRIEEGLMLPIVFPRAERMPTDDVKAEDFVSVWPNRHTYNNCRREYLNAKKAQDNGNGYKMKKLQQEHYLRISSEDDRMIPDILLQTYRRTDILKTLGQYTVFITTDFTTTGDTGSDLSGIAAWALGSNNDYVLLDLSLRKLEIVDQYDTLFRMVETFGATAREITVGIETDGQQKAHIFALKEQMVKRNVWFTFARQKGVKRGGKEGISSRTEGGSKHWRFRMALPLFQNRKMWFPEELSYTSDYIELMEEIKLCTYEAANSKYDDGLDLISMIPAMELITPMKSMYDDPQAIMSGNKRKREGIWATTADDDMEDNAYSRYT